MSDRPGLPVSFLVGIFSAIALGAAWGLVYFSAPAPAPAPLVATLPPAPAPPSGAPAISDMSPAVPPSMSSSARPDAASSDVLPDIGPPMPKPSSEAPPSLPSLKARKDAPASLPRSVPDTHAAAQLPAPPAEDVPAMQSMSPSCIRELEKLCEGTEPGAARRKCFKDHEDKLSPACRRQVDQMASRIQEDMRHFKTACAGDIKQSCPNVAPGGGNILQCLEENYKEVSENCYQALKRFKTMKAGRSL